MTDDTDDSIGVGEDGPTHQPVEHLASLRAIPGLVTLRPGDANEVAGLAAHHGAAPRAGGLDPVAPEPADAGSDEVRRRARGGAGGIRPGRRRGHRRGDSDRFRERGGALHRGVRAAADGGRAGAGGEHAVLGALREAEPGLPDSVLPPAVTARVSVEQASTFGWQRFVGPGGETIGMKTFGASAPLKELQKKFGFTPEGVVAAARRVKARATR